MRKVFLRKMSYAAFALIFLFPIQIGKAAFLSQTIYPDPRVIEILEKLTPEERVGQLFLVTFQGTDVGPETQIYDLVTNHHIGGVFLLAENNNFTDSTYNVNDLFALINQLQLSEYTSSQITSDEQPNENTESSTFIPLFIGTSQEGDGFPKDQILNGLTPLPSQLSIGATWNTALSREIGAVAGKELSDLGINLIFGPSLDVIENPLLPIASQLGTQNFGGDPYWVGEMGRSYVRGLHEGSNGRLVVVGTHFPGLGSADHLPENEVATVRKSLEQLKQIELAPFFTVTGNAITDTEKVDALLTSHIRYQGLQGNIRSTTRPIGFDQQALGLLMELPAFASWREDGGVMISDDLGSRAVRRFYDPTEQEYNARRLALDAFIAGNDLLYLHNFIETNDPDTYTTIIRTLEFFTQKYREDPLFAERVNQSVTRILNLKYKIYDEFDLSEVVITPNYNEIGFSSQITFDVARQGVTLISPTIEELDTVLPEIPGRNEFIVFITDNTIAKQCDECIEQPVIALDALSKAVMNLYGPQASGLVSQYYLRSFSFSQLIDLLNEEGDSNAFINDINRTNWIVFVMQDISEQRPASIAIKRFLSEQPTLYNGKRLIVFTTDAPHYLESTEISKLTAYFGLFSKSTPFIDIAARILFKEIARPQGALPVSVPGVGYDLILATSPDPNQLIPLMLDIPEWVSLEELSPTDIIEIPEYRIGEDIPLRTGVILDSNGHPVPNNTPVQFTITINGEIAPALSTTTTNGSAQASYIVQEAGTLSIQAISGLASSNVLVFEIPQPDATQQPSPTIAPSNTPTIEPSPTSLPPTPVLTPEPPAEGNVVGLEDWLGAVAVASFISWGATRTGVLLGKVRWGIRWGLTGFICGLVFYIYTILGFPGSELFLSLSETWGLIVATFLGTLVGWILALIINTTLKNQAV